MEKQHKGQLAELEQYWSGRAEGYSKVNQDELAGVQKDKWLQFILARMPQGKPQNIAVLDMGTGPGFFAIILTEAGYSVTAADYTPDMLVQAKQNAGVLADKINWIRQDAQHLTLESDQFDVIVTRNLTWNLDDPKQAYTEWLRVLKKGGILLNFDANWYNYLFDETKREEYERDRANVAAMELEDQYTCTDIDAMERLAMRMPLSPVVRPEWDIRTLEEIGFSTVEVEENIDPQVYTEMELVNYAATPTFCIRAVK